MVWSCNEEGCDGWCWEGLTTFGLKAGSGGGCAEDGVATFSRVEQA
jgi:hypothetical protein